MGTPAEDSRIARLEAIRGADSLAALAEVMDVDDPEAAYLAARETWAALREGYEPARDPPGDAPGDVVVVDGTPFHVHGITHAGTEAEGAFLRKHTREWLTGDASVYSEQGIRQLYLSTLPQVCEMDDYRWAMARCRELEGDSHVAGLPGAGALEDVAGHVEELSDRFREVAFSLVDGGDEVYGEGFRDALGDVASAFLTSHADLGMGRDFQAFRLREAAARDPAELVELQRYYERTFLPQPLEREWLRRHDPELELVTHARNARMADYAVYHHETAPAVRLIVGAAHQPGVVYYLEQHRAGERTTDGFRPV